MKEIILVTAMLLLASGNSMAAEGKCRKNKTLYSCSEVKKANRKFFCSKYKKLNSKQITKGCLRARKNIKKKKVVTK
jgi:hypothetical protein